MHSLLTTPNGFSDTDEASRLRKMALDRLKMHSAGIDGVKNWAVAHDALLVALGTPDLALDALQGVMDAFFVAEEGMAASALYGHWK